MTSRHGVIRLRAILWSLVTVVVALAAIEGASIGLTKVQVSEDARTAAREAARAAAGQEITPQVAEAAYAAAAASLTGDEERVVRGSGDHAEAFRVFPDGSVTLTVARRAPTLVLGRFPALEHWVRVTQTQAHAPYGF